jgi:protein-disulfide isomerase-like protein with CxxC motif
MGILIRQAIVTGAEHFIEAADTNIQWMTGTEFGTAARYRFSEALA